MSEQDQNIGKLISVRIRELIQKKGITQAALAMALGVTQGAVSGWCNGAQPRLDQLVKVAQFFGVSLEWILTGSELEFNPWTNEWEGESDEALEKLMLSLPGPDSQKAVDCTRETIRDLRAQAEVFAKHSRNLLIDAERIEENLDHFISQVKTVELAARKAAKLLDARHAPKKGK